MNEKEPPKKVFEKADVVAQINALILGFYGKTAFASRKESLNQVLEELENGLDPTEASKKVEQIILGR